MSTVPAEDETGVERTRRDETTVVHEETTASPDDQNSEGDTSER